MKKLLPFLSLFIISCTSIQIPVQEKQNLKSIFEPETQAVKKYKQEENGEEFLSNILNLLKTDIESLKYSELELRQIDNNNIEIKCIYKNKENAAVLRGEFIGKEFRIRDKHKAIGMPPLAWVLRSTSSSLIKSSNGDLVFYYHHGGVVFLTLLPIFGTSNGQNKYIFRPIN